MRPPSFRTVTAGSAGVEEEAGSTTGAEGMAEAFPCGAIPGTAREGASGRCGRTRRRGGTAVPGAGTAAARLLDGAAGAAATRGGREASRTDVTPRDENRGARAWR
ncbi:hypothetical protein GCM10010433_68640 [Streptomyces pulveraceus]